MNHEVERAGPSPMTVPGAIHIALATADDCRECAALLVGQLSEHGWAASSEQALRIVTQIQAQPERGSLLLAWQEGQPVGVAYLAVILSVEHGGPVAWLEELYVAAAQCGRGIGTALLQAVVNRAMELGVIAIDLEVDASHSRAESLYARAGFCPLSRSRWVKLLRVEQPESLPSGSR